MSDQTLNIDEPDKNVQNIEDDVIHQANDTRNTINNNDHSNGMESDSPKTKADDIKPTENDNIQYAIYEKSLTNDAKTEDKKKLSDSNIDVVDYLKSEFVGLNTKDVKGQKTTDKLPKYSEIDMLGCSHKYSDKPNKVWKYFRQKSLFLKEPVVIQIMGSEFLPENKVIMVYEPETRNHTVKGMFVILMLLHLFTWFFTISLWGSPLREGFIDYGHFICLIPFFFVFLIVILAACFKICRHSCCICCSVFWVMMFQSLGCASFSGYLNIRIFCYAYLALMFTDLVCVVVGCTNFDFTSKKLYAIELTSACLFLIGIIPSLNYFGMENMYYWGDDPFDGENMASHIFNFIFTFAVVIFSVAELHLLLAGEWVELGEDDFSYGGFLMYVSPIDFPIRMLRKYGAFNSCDKGDDEEEE